MAKKKKAAAPVGKDSTMPNALLSPPPPPTRPPSAPPPAPRSTAATAAAAAAAAADEAKKVEADYAGLTISRNKHWRYISAFHGTWLQLPPELLEGIAHSNYLAARPRQTDPGVLFDLVKIRKLVEEATNLAVRAQNGTAASALGADNGFPGGSLGFSQRGGAQAKLSQERKFRMRELAVQKLSHAYRLDEIATSVATMQSSSALDDIGSLVLQRTPLNMDAKYVHFFHEKIPSRMMAHYTLLTPLDDILHQQTSHTAAPMRTRALTRIFKDEHAEAVQDLTEALNVCRLEQTKHHARDLVRPDDGRRHDNRVADDEQPHSLESQLLFQRGNQYLTLADKHVCRALGLLEEYQRLQQQQQQQQQQRGDCGPGEPPSASLADAASEEQPKAELIYQQFGQEREEVRRLAKRALKDFTAFMAALDYAYAPAGGSSDPVFQKQDLDAVISAPSAPLTDSRALVRKRPLDDPLDPVPGAPRCYPTSLLLSAAPPPDLPPFPPAIGSDKALHEMITYHPLLPETLHALLLTHALLQTAPTTMQRIATNAARIAHLADGYPFFLPGRSPSRADWSEVLRKTSNWINLESTWDALCSASLPAAPKSIGNGNQQQPHSRINKEAILGALGDERVVDDDTFSRMVQARKTRAWADEDASPTDALSALSISGTRPSSSAGGAGTPRKVVAKDEEYLIGTARACNIAEWVLRVPTAASIGSAGDGAAAAKRKRKRRAAKDDASTAAGPVER